ncbi:DUF1707 SHOCT-like domain-containing protein [Paractinoplanes brasiliensis]|uniref:Uncharacterized protein DUF1707 n=1 Tax=Paractinoplanes brasiliensis TaxID=52695 RepID=A0A4R6JM63_9ACTN|nr:DUF1707 domain-containing protein [Actinoplanes brasiliensis]TDO37483.1 uncharacterized protein DUF1707 [Actinoplanes brasiliensis]GID29197.1 hypothetical protein Abr02nite_41800 [Actinoplanes brasiliensis]
METNDANWSAASTKRMRTSDSEREHVAEILRAAMAEGRLDLTEGEERLAKAYAAKFRDELAPLTADLPFGGLRALADTPDNRIATRRALRRHASIIVSIGMILTGLWILSGAHFFWPAIPLMFLVIGFMKHARLRRYRYEYSLGHGVAPWNGPGWAGPRQFHSGRPGC